MGRMNVKLVVHGGPAALLDVMEGMVVRNMRALQAREVPALSTVSPKRLRYVAQPTWFDAPSAYKDGMASAGTLAAWRAAEERRKFDDASIRVALVNGVPVTVAGFGGGLRVLDDPSLRHGRDAAFVQPIQAEGDRVVEYLVLDIDDNATAVADIGNSIAHHNARQIRAGEVPRLYGSGIRYVPEGSPEQWLDAKEIALCGQDDCEGLAAYRAGELLVDGLEAGVAARKIAAPSTEMGGSGRGRLFHAITRVQLPDGKVAYDDPSARLGMPVPTWHADQLRKDRRGGRMSA